MEETSKGPWTVAGLLELLDAVMQPGFDVWVKNPAVYAFQYFREPSSGCTDPAWFQDRFGPPAREWQCFVDEHGQPGPYVRWLCLLELIYARWNGGDTWRPSHSRPHVETLKLTNFAKALYRYHPDLEKRDALGEVPKAWKETVRNAFSPTPGAGTVKADFFEPTRHDTTPSLYTALERAWQRIREIDGQSSRDLRLLIAKKPRTDGDTFAVGVERLRSWVAGDQAFLADNLCRLRAELLLEMEEDGSRDTRVKEVVQLLLNPASGKKPVANIFLDDEQTGLRAFATEVCLRLKEESRKVQHPFRPKVIYAALARHGERSDEHTNRKDAVLEEIAVGLGISLDNCLPTGCGPQVDKIFAVQQVLAKSNVIVVLDGMQLAPPPFGAIWDVLRDSDWLSFLKLLIQSPTSHSDGKYKARFLVLSSHELTDLSPWLSYAESLPVLTSKQAALDLLQESAGWQEKWKKLQNRISGSWSPALKGPKPAVDRLQSIYRIEEKEVGHLGDLIENGLPSESVLALFKSGVNASRHMRTAAAQLDGLGNWLYPPPPVVPVDDTADEAADVDYVRHRGVIAQLLAVSVSGLRIDTLARIAERLFMESGAMLLDTMQLSQQDSFVPMLADEKWVHGLVSAYPHMFVISEDGNQLSIAVDFRDFESSRTGAVREISTYTPGNLDLRNERVRELIVAEMLKSSVGAARFMRLHELLAEEATTQLTTRLRHVSSGDTLDEIAFRRGIQALYHGLMSINPDELGEHDPRPQTQPLPQDWTILPSNGYRRWVYLYEFIYRRLLEAPPAWRIGRSLAKEELRLALLATFANPGWARRVHSLLPMKPLENRGFEQFGAFAVKAVDGFGRALQPSALHLRGALGVDLFIALLRACLRSTKHPLFAQRANLIGGQLAVHRPMRATADAEGRRLRTFMKLHVDALQASNELDDAKEVLADELASLGVDIAWMTAEAVEAVFKAAHWDNQKFYADFLQKKVDAVCRRDYRDLEHISDLVFRYGEHFASAADWGDSVKDANGSRARYALAYAVFWLADRVRSSAATLDDSAVHWPSISARAMRYYIRVALKLAKLSAVHAEDAAEDDFQVHKKVALNFFQHAHSRIDVYTRHLASYTTERVHGLLLLASAARVRSSIALRLKRDEAERVKVLPLLKLSRHYLDDAWPVMMQVGAPRAQLRRFYLERLKTYGHLAARDNTAQKRDIANTTAQMDRHVLTDLAGQSEYWKKLIKKLKETDAARRAR